MGSDSGCALKDCSELHLGCDSQTRAEGDPEVLISKEAVVAAPLGWNSGRRVWRGNAQGLVCTGRA